jgi:hypothetical protein
MWVNFIIMFVALKKKSCTAKNIGLEECHLLRCAAAWLL